MGALVQSAASDLQTVVGLNAIGKAGKAIQNGYEGAMGTMTDQYGKTQAYLDPYSETGKDALGQLSDLTKNWQTFDASKLDDDAGYKFRLSEGDKALENSAAAKGSVLSGGQLKALAGYNQRLASQEYQAAYGRFLQPVLHGGGQDAVSGPLPGYWGWLRELFYAERCEPNRIRPFLRCVGASLADRPCVECRHPPLLGQTRSLGDVFRRRVGPGV